MEYMECMICLEELKNNCLKCDRCTAIYCNKCFDKINLKCLQCTKIIDINKFIGKSVDFKDIDKNKKSIVCRLIEYKL